MEGVKTSGSKYGLFACKTKQYRSQENSSQMTQNKENPRVCASAVNWLHSFSYITCCLYLKVHSQQNAGGHPEGTEHKTNKPVRLEWDCDVGR